MHQLMHILEWVKILLLKHILAQSRRDDLEGIGYVLVYLVTGTLPWQGVKAHNRHEKYQIIMEKKMATPPELLCKNLPRKGIYF